MPRNRKLNSDLKQSRDYTIIVGLLYMTLCIVLLNEIVLNLIDSLSTSLTCET